jgi:hypothetical protein
MTDGGNGPVKVLEISAHVWLFRSALQLLEGQNYAAYCRVSKELALLDDMDRLSASLNRFGTISHSRLS